jgi:integrase
LAALTSALWDDLGRSMTMKDAHDALKAMLKAELDDYAGLKRELTGGLARIQTPSRATTLDLDDMKLAEPAAEKPVTSRVGLTVRAAARDAIREMSRTENMRPKRRRDYENAVEAFVAWCETDVDLAVITPEMVGQFKADLSYYPARGSVRPVYRDQPWKARVERARQIDEADVLNAATINTKYLTPLKRIIEFHRDAGLKQQLPINPFEGISAKAGRTAKRDGRRREFTDAEVRTLFREPLFTGAEGQSQAALYRPGPERVNDWRYWVPLISFFTGARLNEVCALAVTDFREVEGIHYFNIRDMIEGQNRKSDAGWRQVPLHSALLQLRLPDFVAQRKASGAVRLFEELEVDAFGYVSGKPSKFLNRLTERVAEPDPEQPGKLVFYSSRHTVIGRLRSAEVRLDVAKQIVGHEDGDVHSGYGGFSLRALKDSVDKIAYANLDLSSVELPTSILPRSKS